MWPLAEVDKIERKSRNLEGWNPRYSKGDGFNKMRGKKKLCRKSNS